MTVFLYHEGTCSYKKCLNYLMALMLMAWVKWHFLMICQDMRWKATIGNSKTFTGVCLYLAVNVGDTGKVSDCGT